VVICDNCGKKLDYKEAFTLASLKDNKEFCNEDCWSEWDSKHSITKPIPEEVFDKACEQIFGGNKGGQ
jgi:hypothetical protein